MKLRVARVGVLIATVMGLMLTMTPAEATWVKTVTFTGSATLLNCGGFGSPGVDGVVPDTKTTTKLGPKGEPEVNTEVLNGNKCDFVLSTTACVKESVGKKLGTDVCVITAVGTVLGFCGLSFGTGRAVITNLTNTVQPKPDVVTDFKFSSTGTTLRVSGGNMTQNVHGEVSAVPSATGSCTNKTATGFLVSGEVVVKRVT